MGGRRIKGRCGRRERDGGRAVGEDLLGGGLLIEGGSLRKEKWEGEGTLRIDQEDMGAMNTHTGTHYTWILQEKKYRELLSELPNSEYVQGRKGGSSRLHGSPSTSASWPPLSWG